MKACINTLSEIDFLQNLPTLKGIQKTYWYDTEKYSNIFQRIISFFTMGFKFNQFTIYDNHQHLIAHVKVKTQMTQKHFEVTYYSNSGESQILFDKQSNGREETYGIMKYNGIIYNIHSDENRYTVIKDTKEKMK